MDENPDYLTVTSCIDSRRYLVVLMRYNRAVDSYQQADVWGPYVHELAQSYARIEAKQRGVEVR